MNEKYIISYRAGATGVTLYYNVETAEGYTDKTKATKFADYNDAELIAGQFHSSSNIEAI